MTTETKNETEIVVVLDRSFSMTKIAKATVDGFNTFLKEQQNAEGTAFITLVQFDDRYEIDYKSIPVKEARELVLNETFVPRGSTALLDALGKTIEELKTDRDVVFVILTDGEENASLTYKRDAIFKMIETQQNELKWKFIFMGANQDAIAVGSTLGISSKMSMTYGADDIHVVKALSNMSSNMTMYRSAKGMGGEFNDDSLSFSNDQREESK